MRNIVQLTKLDVKMQVDTTPRTSWQIHRAVRKHFESQGYLFDFTHDSVKRFLIVYGLSRGNPVALHNL